MKLYAAANVFVPPAAAIADADACARSDSRETGEERKRGVEKRAGERESRATGAADSLCPRKLCSSPRLPLPLPPSLPPASAAFLLHPSPSPHSPHALTAPAPLPPALSRSRSRSHSRSRSRSRSPPNSLPLPRHSAESSPVPPPPSSSSSVSLLPFRSGSATRSLLESSQPDAGPARGRNDPRARQGRTEGVIRSSPYVHRAARSPGIRIIKLCDSLLAHPPHLRYCDLALDNGSSVATLQFVRLTRVRGDSSRTMPRRGIPNSRWSLSLLDGFFPITFPRLQAAETSKPNARRIE